MTKARSQLSRKTDPVGVASHLMVIMDKGKDQAELAAKNIADSLHTSLDDLKGWALVGDVAEVVHRIEAYNEVGVSYHVLNFGTKVRDEAKIELFA